MLTPHHLDLEKTETTHTQLEMPAQIEILRSSVCHSGTPPEDNNSMNKAKMLDMARQRRSFYLFGTEIIMHMSMKKTTRNLS